MSGGKLGVGFYLNRPEFVQHAVNCGARAVLLFEDALHLAAEIKTQAPGMELVGRKGLTEQEQWARLYPTNRRQIAADWINESIDQYPAVDCWQVYNEVVATGRSDLLRLQVDAEHGAADAALHRGKTVCVLNQPPGNYPTNDPADTARWWWPEWLSIVRLILSYPGVRYLGIHLYSGADRTPLNTPDAEWYALRYRKLLRDLKAAGAPHPPLLPTEYGHSGGWRRWLSGDNLIVDLTWLGDRFNEDPELRCGFYFLEGDCGGWGDYDIADTSVPAALAAWNRAHPAPELIPVPAPEPAPSGGTTMDEATQTAMIEMEARQNALLTQALKAFRQGKFDGADGIDGIIVALQGGKPLDFMPSYPPKA